MSPSGGCEAHVGSSLTELLILMVTGHGLDRRVHRHIPRNTVSAPWETKACSNLSSPKDHGEAAPLLLSDSDQQRDVIGGGQWVRDVGAQVDDQG